MDRVSPETSADNIMAEPLETNSVELRIAFHNAVSRIAVPSLRKGSLVKFHPHGARACILHNLVKKLG
jgi:hypothetical protein